MTRLPVWPHAGSPFHPGEQALQRRAGVREQIEALGRRMVRSDMPEQHRAFFAQLPFLVLGALDGTGQPWATLLFGQPGFASSPTSDRLDIAAPLLEGDPLTGQLQTGAPLGLLGIELHTRRRNRLNGTVTSADAHGFTLAVTQSFGNCPQYIQRRDYQAAPTGSTPPAPEWLDGLDAAARASVAAADTFFIASHAAGGEGETASYGVDVSHRGGKPGFVRVDDAGMLTWPEFRGNFHFNTLGNLQLNPRAGLLFPNFAGGGLLYLAGRAEIVWDGTELHGFAGAERLVRFRIERVLRLAGRMPLRWRLDEASPLLAATGDWRRAEQAATLAEQAERWRPFRVVRIEAESATIKSFYLQPADGLGIAPHLAGQFLPIRLAVPGQGVLRRHYTLSQAADGHGYRLSVKRAGTVSAYLHDQIAVGDRLEALAPRGAFTLEAGSNRPVLLLSGGVGITPMLAMLGALFPADGVGHRLRPTWFIHAARNGRELAFAPTLRALAAAQPALQLHVALSQPDAADRQGVDYDSVGRIDAALLRRLLPLDDYEVYLCGPDAFMRTLHAELRALGVAAERLHRESFGPTAPSAAVSEDAPPQPVRFAASGIAGQWRPESGSLLALAEQAGLQPAYGCRNGLCGSCATRLLSGQVSYAVPPSPPPAPGEVLLCCARPISPVTLAL